MSKIRDRNKTIKIKEILLKYSEEDFDRIKKVKERWAITWENLVFMAILDLK